MTNSEIARQLGIKGASLIPEKELTEKIIAMVKAAKAENAKYVFGGKGKDKDGNAIVTKSRMHVSGSVLISDFEDADFNATRTGDCYETGEALPTNITPPALKSWISRNLVILKEDYDKIGEKVEKKEEAEKPKIKR